MTIRTEIYLVTVEQFKAETAAKGHTEDFNDKVLVAIRNAQKRLKSILCDETYNKLLTDFDNGNITSPYTDLLPFAQEYVVWKAYELWIPVSGVQSTEVGYRSFVDENSDSVTKQTLKELTQYANDQTSYFKGELDYYLQTNIDSFPIYKKSNCNNCKQSNQANRYVTGAGNKKKTNLNLYESRSGKN